MQEAFKNLRLLNPFQSRRQHFSWKWSWKPCCSDYVKNRKTNMARRQWLS